MVLVGRRGRSQKFLDHWHQRDLELAGGDRLTWLLIDDPAHPAQCFSLISAGGTIRLLHATEALELLVAHHHADAEHVPLATPVGRTFNTDGWAIRDADHSVRYPVGRPLRRS